MHRAPEGMAMQQATAHHTSIRKDELACANQTALCNASFAAKMNIIELVCPH